MANEQVKVPLFAASEILTAANMNISAGTGVPVFATTVTRDAAFGGAGEKVLAEGQLCYLSDANVVQYYDGAAWATVGPASAGALVRVGGGALSSTTTAFANVFSATYNAYIISLSNIASVTADQWIQLTMTGTTTGYSFGANTVTYAGSQSFLAGANQASWQYIAITGSGKANGANIQLINPFATKETVMNYQSQWTNTTGGYSITGGGFLNNTTSYTGFTLTSASGNFSGTVNVYGLALS